MVFSSRWAFCSSLVLTVKADRVPIRMEQISMAETVRIVIFVRIECISQFPRSASAFIETSA